MAKSGIEVEATVLEEFKGDVYLCEIGNGTKVKAKRCGKMTQNRIKVIAGDRCLVELSPYDLSRGRITFRFKE